MPIPRIRFLAGATAASLALMLAAPSASAHAELEKAMPPAGGMASAPTEIRLTFSEAIEPRFTGVTLTGPGGAVPLGPAKAEAGDQAVLIAPIAKPLPAGVYTVHWRAVSTDTHHTRGTFTFTVKP